MKKIIAICLCMTMGYLSAQNAIRPVYTGAPFLRISPDARAGGLGDMGVATSSDVFSQYWNPAKYLFSKNQAGVGISYTPYLSSITNDVFLLNGSFYTFLDEDQNSTLGASIYYFNLGEIQLSQLGVNNEIISTGIAKPNEFAIDFSYGLKLSDNYGMAVALRYIRSDLFNGLTGDEAAQTKPGSSFAVDVAGFYDGELHDYRNFDGRLRLGFNIKNIGPKLDYSDSNNNAAYLPTNLGLAAGYEFNFDETNKVTLGLELNKLLVPSQVAKTNADGTITYEQPEKGVIGGVFSSFGDAPDGIKEEMKEVTYAASAEYTYNNAFSFRTGYFHESLDKGARQYATLGAGFKYNAFGVDVSYLIPTTSVNNALENTLRFGLTWNFGAEIDTRE